VFRLGLPIDAGFNVTELACRGINKAMAESDVTRR